MTRADFHVHTSYCDGSASAEEMVRAALCRGMRAIGFSGHSYTSFDDCCMTVAGTAAYRAEIKRLKEACAGKIAVYCGIEQDLLSDLPAEGYDYVIGSVHYLRCGDEYVSVDDTPEKLLAGAARHFGGDRIALAAAYFRSVARVHAVTGCGIVGHFDLVTKFNEGGALFDEADPRYVSAWHDAADALLPTGALFEINTGAIARKRRKTPYPSAESLDYLISKGARFLLSGDAHSPDALCYGFDEWGAWARSRGAELVDTPDFCIQ